ncbi:MAG: filamentous hemagglutinin N-terminal protein, partial [Polaromonas sp.]|nr:filamentous hemagglutinin N-terminal protein [Polaromonas sp.]
MHSRSISPDRFSRPARATFALKALPAALALMFSQPGLAVDIAGAAGLPQNGSVFAGSATGSVSGNQLTVNQASARAVLDWASFNIDAGKAVQFIQPGAGSAVLNRITGDANPSHILGSLSANGTVMLMNPNGIMFGAGAVVNVGSLVATTGTIDVNA